MVRMSVLRVVAMRSVVVVLASGGTFAESVHAQVSTGRATSLPVQVGAVARNVLAGRTVSAVFGRAGGIVFLTTDPSDAIFLAGDGKPIVELVRKEEGDSVRIGRWRGPVQVDVLGKDTLVVRDHGARVEYRRSPRVDIASRAITAQPAERFRLVSGRTIVSGESDVLANCRPILPSVVGSGPSTAYIDRTGGTWLRDPRGQWQHFARANRNGVRIAGLPSGLRITDVVGDTVLGLVTTGTGERLPARYAVRGLARSTAPLGCAESGEPELKPPPRERMLELRGAIRMAMVEGTTFHDRNNRYPSSGEELSFARPSHVRFWVLEASKSGWFVAVGTEVDPFVCAVAFGAAVPVGWADGAMVCGW